MYRYLENATLIPTSRTMKGDESPLLRPSRRRLARRQIRLWQPPHHRFPDLLRTPDRVTVFDGNGAAEAVPLRPPLDRRGYRNHRRSPPRRPPHQLPVTISAPKSPLTQIQLRWRSAVPETWRFLGDHWERSLWRSRVARHGRRPRHALVLRRLRWPRHARLWREDRRRRHRFLAGRRGRRHAVARRPQRRLRRATSATAASKPPPSSAHSHLRRIAHGRHAPTLPKPCAITRACRPQPVYGGNNWYYTYGRNFSPPRPSCAMPTLMADPRARTASQPSLHGARYGL